MEQHDIIIFNIDTNADGTYEVFTNNAKYKKCGSFHKVPDNQLYNTMEWICRLVNKMSGDLALFEPRWEA